MSKKYMDFVPAKNADKRTAVVLGAPRRTNVAKFTSVETTVASEPKVVMPESTATPRSRMVRKDVSGRVAIKKTTVQQRTMKQQKIVAQPRIVVQKDELLQYQSPTTGFATSNFAIREEVKLGEIEDLSPKFVNVDVPKRPLGDRMEHQEKDKGSLTDTKNEATVAKSKRLIGRFRNKSAVKGTVKASAKTEKKAISKKDTFVTPRPTFINQDKVAKRPLSKNAYQKNNVTTGEGNNKGPVAIIAKSEKESKVGLVVAIILTIILGAVAGTIAFLLLPK